MNKQSVEPKNSKQSQNKHKWTQSQDLCLLEIVYSMLPDILSTCRNPHKSWNAALNLFNEKSNVQFKQGRTLKERFKVLQRSYAALFSSKPLSGNQLGSLVSGTDIFLGTSRTPDHDLRPMEPELQGMMQKISKSLKNINNLNSAVIDLTKQLTDDKGTTSSSNMPSIVNKRSLPPNYTILQTIPGEPQIAKRRLVDYIDHIGGELLQKDKIVQSTKSTPPSRSAQPGSGNHLSDYPNSNDSGYLTDPPQTTSQQKRSESGVIKFADPMFVHADNLSQIKQLQEQIKFLEAKVIQLDQTLNSKVDLILRYMGQQSEA